MPEQTRNIDGRNAGTPKSAVVASLPKRAPHPYSSIALSPDRLHAVASYKDTLQILAVDSQGIHLLRTIPIGHHFQVSTARAAAGEKSGDVHNSGRRVVSTTGTLMNRIHEDLSLFHPQSAAPPPNDMFNLQVVVTNVAWSANYSDAEGKSGGKSGNGNSTAATAADVSTSFIAAAGSNGVTVVWSATTLLEASGVVGTGGGDNSVPLDKNKSRGGLQHPAPSITPEAVLSDHSRAVNRLAWHPKTPGLLLTASQDSTVLLWERKTLDETSRDNERKTKPGLNFLFGRMTSQVVPQRSYTWRCRAKFEPKSEAVRDVQWSPFYDDVFALVTSSGTLISYHIVFPHRALHKIAAHSEDATTLDWHPIHKDILATGGANDRSVKVWNLEKYLNMNKDEGYMLSNMNTLTSVQTSATDSSGETDRSAPPHIFIPAQWQPSGTRTTSTGNSALTSRKGSPKNLLHNLAISAQVTKIRWRPPANETFFHDEDDHYESMMAVATAPIKGASAGGSGVLALWSTKRPFMPLSILEGHKEGAVTDFDWLEMPHSGIIDKSASFDRMSPPRMSDLRRHVPNDQTTSQQRGDSNNLILYNKKEKDKFKKPLRIWQHVISVGRDGRCLIQSFVRGDYPIMQVPPSCFAMANLSPFQKGYGSLQIFSVCQPIPTDPKTNFILTGLRRDKFTKSAPGIFCEDLLQDNTESAAITEMQAGKQFSQICPQLVFNVVDQGDLDNSSRPVEKELHAFTVAPEVVHLSRFASRYSLYPNAKYTSRVSLCMNNSKVAASLNCAELANLWETVALMMEFADMDELPDMNAGKAPQNVMQFVILPTIKNLLEERADFGDVQTCVALCEVLQVVQKDETVRIPELDINLVREWYLSYIDLLRDMCLFSQASFLIRSCNDPFISSLNQQSTTIHESCPCCGKPLPPTEITDDNQGGPARRACKNCLCRVGLCFLCHEPVRGMFVWCPGCGHGGHLDHALQWFGGMVGNAVREMCPTGCGHRCNMVHQLTAFPRTESLRQSSLAELCDSSSEEN